MTKVKQFSSVHVRLWVRNQSMGLKCSAPEGIEKFHFRQKIWPNILRNLGTVWIFLKISKNLGKFGKIFEKFASS